MQKFSTADIQPQDRVAAWSDHVCRYLSQIDYVSGLTSETTATLSSDTLASIRITKVVIAGLKQNRYSLGRASSENARSGRRDCVLRICLEGVGRTAQNGRTAEMTPGDMVIFDESRPFSVEKEGDGSSLYLFLPGDALKERIHSYEHALGCLLRGNVPLVATTRMVLTSLAEIGTRVSAEHQVRLADQAIDLVGMILAETAEASLTPSAYRAALVYRIKLHIEDRLGDAGLNAALIADAFRITPRHVSRLFAAEGMTIGQFILDRRLERCWRILREQSSRGRLIEDVAHALGFRSASHFARAFAAKYGQSPRAFRNQAIGKSKT